MLSRFSRVRLSVTLWNCSPPGSSVHGKDSPGKDTRAVCHALLQGIVPTQGSNPQLLPYVGSFPLVPPGKPSRGLRRQTAATRAKGCSRHLPRLWVGRSHQHPHYYEEHELLPRIEAVDSTPCTTLTLEVPKVTQILETFLPTPFILAALGLGCSTQASYHCVWASLLLEPKVSRAHMLS